MGEAGNGRIPAEFLLHSLIPVDGQLRADVSTVEVNEREGGGYTVIETDTGALGEGETLADALEQLVENLRKIERGEEETDPEATYERVADRVRRRFEEEEVTEEDIEDAIEWARSE